MSAPGKKSRVRKCDRQKMHKKLPRHTPCFHLARAAFCVIFFGSTVLPCASEAGQPIDPAGAQDCEGAKSHTPDAVGHAPEGDGNVAGELDERKKRLEEKDEEACRPGNGQETAQQGAVAAAAAGVSLAQAPAANAGPGALELLVQGAACCAGRAYCRKGRPSTAPVDTATCISTWEMSLTACILLDSTLGSTRI